MNRTAGALSVLVFALTACDEGPSATDAAATAPGPAEPTIAAARSGSPLLQAAAAAVQLRYPGQLWANAREKRGLREDAVCAEVAGEQVIYRERRMIVMAQSDFTKEGWPSMYEGWCATTPFR